MASRKQIAALVGLAPYDFDSGKLLNIRDAREGREGKEDDPGVEQKRMLITLAEFGSVLALVRRPGRPSSP